MNCRTEFSVESYRTDAHTDTHMRTDRIVPRTTTVIVNLQTGLKFERISDYWDVNCDVFRVKNKTMTARQVAQLWSEKWGDQARSAEGAQDETLG